MNKLITKLTKRGKNPNNSQKEIDKLGQNLMKMKKKIKEPVKTVGSLKSRTTLSKCQANNKERHCIN